MDNVVRLYKDDAIAFVALEEKEYKNTFSFRFIDGIRSVFDTIANDSTLKVVIVHGYDNYFCCGGTKDELIGLHKGIGKEEGQGGVQFTDKRFHDIFLQCEIPVIAAMQGHALGGGLALGCFADIIILSEQCIYSANFMKYGFTPGMGATYIIPKKFGRQLGTEMLMSARNYYGKELKELGAPVRIVDKQNVMQLAVEIARNFVDKSLLSLKLLKNNLNADILNEIDNAIKKELEMHRLTFTQPEVLHKIEELFGN
ncbi:MAG: enoyl-CoA hydratase/isomerase family protein [Spirochaetales bacterium]|nr:enoyl-CoA hydratase/isomerase family protein [Spirochaetales bacterium]